MHRHALLLAAALAGCASHAAAPSAPPPAPAPGPAAALASTPACSVLGAWLRALDADDPAMLVMRSFLKEHADAAALQGGVEQRLAALARMREETGGFVPRRVIDAATCAVLAQDRVDGLWVRLEPKVGESGRLYGIAIRPGYPEATDAAPAPRDDAEVARLVEGFVARRAAADRFSGSVVIVHRGQPVVQRAWGLASQAYQVANRVDTRFNLGSMNKMFTAVSIMQLVEQGKVTLDDTIGKWLPDYPNADARDKVTVRMLLTHTSGLGSYWNEKFEQNKLRIRAVADYLPTFAEEPLAFAPGSRFAYSNAGFIVLGAIIEKAAGEDYFAYVREHVYRPAGMTDTDCYDLALDTPNLAVGYTWLGPDGQEDRSRRHNNTFFHVIKGGPAGGGYASGPDLIRFAEALLDGRLVKPESFAAMTTAQSAMTVDEPYGYGLTLGEARGHKIIGHSGGFPGISSQLDVYPSGEWIVAVLSNYDGGAQPVMSFTRELLTRPR